MLCIAAIGLHAQNKIFKHTATAANTTADYTLIDHPALNGNPDAKLIVSHAFNPILPGAGVYNNRISGVRYNTAAAKWTVYNEDATPLVPGSSYFVYLPDDDHGFHHIATQENTFLVVSRLDIPEMNGNTAAIAVVSNSYLARRNVGNPTLAYVSWVGTSNPGWNVYLTPGTMELGCSFFIATAGDPGIVAIKHTATTGNIANHATVLNHPLLNGNPNAKFVFSRNQEVVSQNTGSGDNFPKILSAQYFFNKWMIFTEDQSPMLPNLVFNILIEDPSLGTNDQSKAQFSAYPNPVADKVTITTEDKIIAIAVYNAAGQQVQNVPVNFEEKSIDMAALPSGLYWAKVQTGTGFGTVKLLRK